MDEIIQKIQKLLAMTTERGCTPAEAAHAAAKAQEFMRRHGLSIFDVEAKTYGEKVEEEHRDLDFERLPAWVYDMASAVARPNGCAYVMVGGRQHDGKRYKTTHRLKFIGHSTDVKIVAYLYDTLSRALWQMSAQAGREHGRKHALLAKFRWDFMRGAALAINERLRAENQGAAAELGAPQASNSTPGKPNAYGAMVVVKGRAVQEYITRAFPELRTVRNAERRKDDSAVRAGYAAGKAIPLRKGLEGTAQGRLES